MSIIESMVYMNFVLIVRSCWQTSFITYWKCVSDFISYRRIYMTEPLSRAKQSFLCRDKRLWCVTWNVDACFSWTSECVRCDCFWKPSHRYRFVNLYSFEVRQKWSSLFICKRFPNMEDLWSILRKPGWDVDDSTWTLSEYVKKLLGTELESHGVNFG